MDSFWLLNAIDTNRVSLPSLIELLEEVDLSVSRKCSSSLRMPTRSWADPGGGGPDPPPLFFACRPKMDPPLKNPGSAPEGGALSGQVDSVHPLEGQWPMEGH